MPHSFFPGHAVYISIFPSVAGGTEGGGRTRKISATSRQRLYQLGHLRMLSVGRDSNPASANAPALQAASIPRWSPTDR